MCKIMQIGSLNDLLENLINDDVVDLNNPTCREPGCNECCTMGAGLTESEYSTILSYLTTETRGIQLYTRSLKMIKDYLDKGTIYWMCPLSDPDTKKCGIYDIRPKVCRDFHCSSKLNKLIKNNENDSELKYIIANLFL